MVGVVRPDVNVAQVVQMVIGLQKTPASEAGEVEHLVRIALDALRYQVDAVDCSRGPTSRGEALSRPTARLNRSGPQEERAGPCAQKEEVVRCCFYVVHRSIAIWINAT
jgi:hypothetical protein